jgi:hypothetical protein
MLLEAEGPREASQSHLLHGDEGGEGRKDDAARREVPVDNALVVNRLWRARWASEVG